MSKKAIIVAAFCLGGCASSPEDYLLRVSLDEQKIAVYHKGHLIKELLCSTAIKPGGTPAGDFKTYYRKESDGWREPDGTELSYHYITRFNKFISFHSLLEGGHPFAWQGKKLFRERKTSSMGCVRLRKTDAKWIYELPLGVAVKVRK